MIISLKIFFFPFVLKTETLIQQYKFIQRKLIQAIKVTSTLDYELRMISFYKLLLAGILNKAFFFLTISKANIFSLHTLELGKSLKLPASLPPASGFISPFPISLLVLHN